MPGFRRAVSSAPKRPSTAPVAVMGWARYLGPLSVRVCLQLIRTDRLGGPAGCAGRGPWELVLPRYFSLGGFVARLQVHVLGEVRGSGRWHEGGPVSPRKD
jgi:hypothetical protein